MEVGARIPLRPRNESATGGRRAWRAPELALVKDVLEGERHAGDEHVEQQDERHNGEEDADEPRRRPHHTGAEALEAHVLTAQDEFEENDHGAQVGLAKVFVEARLGIGVPRHGAAFRGVSDECLLHEHVGRCREEEEEGAQDVEDPPHVDEHAEHLEGRHGAHAVPEGLRGGGRAATGGLALDAHHEHERAQGREVEHREEAQTEEKDGPAHDLDEPQAVFAGSCVAEPQAPRKRYDGEEESKEVREVELVGNVRVESQAKALIAPLVLQLSHLRRDLAEHNRHGPEGDGLRLAVEIEGGRRECGAEDEKGHRRAPVQEEPYARRLDEQ